MRRADASRGQSPRRRGYSTSTLSPKIGTRSGSRRGWRPTNHESQFQPLERQSGAMLSLANWSRAGWQWSSLGRSHEYFATRNILSRTLATPLWLGLFASPPPRFRHARQIVCCFMSVRFLISVCLPPTSSHLTCSLILP